MLFQLYRVQIRNPIAKKLQFLDFRLAVVEYYYKCHQTVSAVNVLAPVSTASKRRYVLPQFQNDGQDH